MIWLGKKRGYLTDWITQVWVRATGKKLNLCDYPWLEGPVGSTDRIGTEYFNNLALREKLKVCKDGTPRGIVPNFDTLKSKHFDPNSLNPQVIDFYEKTSEYELDAWSQWCGAFRPLGGLLAVGFSRRLQQMNVPLSGLDTSKGVTSEVYHLIDPNSGGLKYAVWVRHLVGSQNVLYVGSYGPCRVPNFDGVCLKVVFPLPNGNALVIMRPESHSDGSLSLVSSGDGFGSPGFYFVVQGEENTIWVRYVKPMRERIRVYAVNNQEIRADHTLRIWGLSFLRLHYRMRCRFPDSQPV